MAAIGSKREDYIKYLTARIYQEEFKTERVNNFRGQCYFCLRCILAEARVVFYSSSDGRIEDRVFLHEDCFKSAVLGEFYTKNDLSD